MSQFGIRVMSLAARVCFIVAMIGLTVSRHHRTSSLAAQPRSDDTAVRELSAAVEKGLQEPTASARRAAVRKVVDSLVKEYKLTPKAFEIAEKVQARLQIVSSKFAGRYWRDESIPRLLQGSFSDIELLRASAGDEFPVNWVTARDWIRPWVEQVEIAPGKPIDDGFLGPLGSVW